MIIIKIKAYRLKEFPRNSKLIEQGEDIKRIVFEIDTWNGVFANILSEIQLIYNLLNSSFKIYWKDEDDELIRLTNDKDVKVANQFSNGLIKIYVIQNALNNQLQKNNNKEKITIDRSKQKHVGFYCDACREPILGIKYKCEKCAFYNLCEDCHAENDIHAEHKFTPIPSVYGYNMCDECQSEITANFHICKDCTSTRVPILNNAINTNPDLEGLRGKVFYLAYLICDECKSQRHNNHALISKNISDLNLSHQLLLNEIKTKRARGEDIRSHLGVKCCNCQNNASLKSTLPYYEEVLICEECFKDGAFKHQMAFTWLLTEEATYIRNRNQNNKEYYNKLKFEQLKQQIEHQNRMSDLVSGRYQRYY